MITDGLPGLIKICTREMISHLRQIIITWRYLGRENGFGHKLLPARLFISVYLSETQLKAALVAWIAIPDSASYSITLSLTAASPRKHT
jgi:hypothetical protein